MKRILAFTLLAMLILQASAGAQKDDKPSVTKLGKYSFIGESYDRFKDRIKVELADIVVESGTFSTVMGRGYTILLDSIVIEEGKKLKETSPSYLGVMIHTPLRVPVLDAPTIYILADGQRIVLDKPERLGDLEYRGEASEILGKHRLYVGSRIDWNDYKKIAHSSKVEIKVDRFEFELKPDALSRMRTFISYVDQRRGVAPNASGPQPSVGEAKPSATPKRICAENGRRIPCPEDKPAIK
jgi:hypothetical protein